jgi:hypothetical protein
MIYNRLTKGRPNILPQSALTRCSRHSNSHVSGASVTLEPARFEN